MAPLTGRKVLAITLAAFGVIVGVNILLAVMAVRTFPGTETHNSYVESQRFDRDRAAQEALGWQVETAYDAGWLSVAITEAGTGLPVVAREMSALVGWATSTEDDFTPAFRYENGAYVTRAELAPGNWIVHLRATAEDGTPFRQRVPLLVRPHGRG